jgi:hypothetical protein
MPFRTKKSRRHKSILRKSKRRNRTRRVRFAGGVVGPKWMGTPFGDMTLKNYEQYQNRLSPEAY